MKQDGISISRLGLCFVLFILVADPVLGETGPDELYRQGKYAQAQDGYSRLDMDNPGDIRFRYNKGCAAYQAQDYDSARAAFSSALHRAGDDDMRFRTLYNLGNTAYRQGDFSSAAGYYKDAIVIDPGSSDARYNLELALAAEKSQQPSPEDEPGGDQKDGSQQDKASDNGKKQDASDDGTAGDSQGDQSEKDAEKKARDQEKADEGPDESRAAGADEGEEPDDLSGELTGPKGGAGAMQPDQGETGSSSMDERRAKALLDNITEDRSRLYRHEGGRSGPASGKDW
ncbi:MAG TPA: tetratricopeptide repeat protein [Deltaproteobacteria bacterium]|nr:tetratricopeptide repeat protein [Deltaproteobacteria bacterium]